MPTQHKSYKNRFKALKTPVSSTVNAALSSAYMLAMYGTKAIGMDLLSLQSEKSIDQFFSPQGRAAILESNRAGIKVKSLVPGIEQSIKALDTHFKELIQTKTGFETYKEPLKASRNPDDTDTARLNNLTQIETNLNITRSLHFDLKEFKSRFEVLKDLLSRDEVDDPRTILSYVDLQLKNLTEQLKLKKAEAIKKVQDQMTLIRTTPNLLPEEDIHKLEQTLLQNINESYDKFEKAIKKDFEDGTPAAKEGEKAVPSIKQMLKKEVEKAEAELFSFVIFSEKTKSKQVVEANPGMIGMPGADQGRKYRSMTFEDYVRDQPERSHAWISIQAWWELGQYLMNKQAELHTVSGLRMKYDGQGGVSIDFPHGLSFYYHYQDRLLGADIMLMVEAIKLQGKDEITLTLEVHNPKLRQKIMEEFYYAAALQGFSPDKIKFNVTMTEDPSKSISNKTASEIMGQLGSAQTKVNNKQQAWQQEQALVEKETTINLNRRVANLDEKIDDILNRPALSAHTSLSI